MLYEDDSMNTKEEFLIYGQHYGNLDMLRLSDFKKVLQSKFLKVWWALVRRLCLLFQVPV